MWASIFCMWLSHFLFIKLLFNILIFQFQPSFSLLHLHPQFLDPASLFHSTTAAFTTSGWHFTPSVIWVTWDSTVIRGPRQVRMFQIRSVLLHLAWGKELRTGWPPSLNQDLIHNRKVKGKMQVKRKKNHLSYRFECDFFTGDLLDYYRPLIFSPKALTRLF